MKNLAIIIQARTGSTRLPNKILLPFVGNKTILEIIVERLKKHYHLPIIIATTKDKNDDIIEIKAQQLNIDCFRGSENDVLKRFIEAAETFSFENIIRVCADNPFLNMDAMNELIKVVSHNDCDYIGFTVNDKPSITTHFGFWAEFVSLDALKTVSTLTNEAFFHEHVTNYIYNHPDKFKIKWIKTPESLNGREDIRLTIDTIADFTNGKHFFEFANNKTNKPTIDELINILDENSKYLDIMKVEILKNTK